MADAQSIAIQYAPFNSRVHPGFWNTFTKLKLDVLGLTEKSVRVIVLYFTKSKFQINCHEQLADRYFANIYTVDRCYSIVLQQ